MRDDMMDERNTHVLFVIPKYWDLLFLICKKCIGNHHDLYSTTNRMFILYTLE